MTDTRNSHLYGFRCVSPVFRLLLAGFWIGFHGTNENGVVVVVTRCDMENNISNRVHKIDGLHDDCCLSTTGAFGFTTMGKRTQQMKYKRAPGAPRRFKSAYMFFSAVRHRTIREQAVNKKIRSSEVAKLISRAWRELPECEKTVWRDMARQDKVRYEAEKAAYTGPWKVADVKDPTAPKKPMSAFLAFGNERRGSVARANPTLNGTEISCLLAKLWRESSDDVRKAYRDREAHQRAQYKERRAEWEQQKKNLQEEVESLSEAGSSEMQTTGNALVPRENQDRWCPNDVSSVVQQQRRGSFSLLSGQYAAPPPPVRPFAVDQIRLPQRIIEPTESLGIIQPLCPHIPFVSGQRSPEMLDHYSVEDLLQDEDLLKEDFSPLDVPCLISWTENL